MDMISEDEAKNVIASLIKKAAWYIDFSEYFFEQLPGHLFSLKDAETLRKKNMNPQEAVDFIINSNINA